LKGWKSPDGIAQRPHEPSHGIAKEPIIFNDRNQYFFITPPLAVRSSPPCGRPPIIFITGHGDIPMSVQAMKEGAIEFLTKPFRDQDLLDAIQLGLSRDRAWRENEEALAGLRERFASLSPREREIMIQVARGRVSKQIAGDIGIAEATVKVHRSRAMHKMNARSLSSSTEWPINSSWCLTSRKAFEPACRHISSTISALRLRPQARSRLGKDHAPPTN
jgi:DNA-binding NarL/FixJ family response regulator